MSDIRRGIDLIDAVRAATGPDKGRAAADLAVALMEGDESRLKAGYSFSNALLAAAEVAAVLDSPGRIALLAERMYELLAERVCACCDEAGKPGAPGAGGAPWICNDCAAEGVPG